MSKVLKRQKALVWLGLLSNLTQNSQMRNRLKKVKMWQKISYKIPWEHQSSRDSVSCWNLLPISASLTFYQQVMGSNKLFLLTSMKNTYLQDTQADSLSSITKENILVKWNSLICNPISKKNDWSLCVCQTISNTLYSTGQEEWKREWKEKEKERKAKDKVINKKRTKKD